MEWNHNESKYDKQHHVIRRGLWETADGGDRLCKETQRQLLQTVTLNSHKFPFGFLSQTSKLTLFIRLAIWHQLCKLLSFSLSLSLPRVIRHEYLSSCQSLFSFFPRAVVVVLAKNTTIIERI
jgi:hypothetical protein